MPVVGGPTGTLIPVLGGEAVAGVVAGVVGGGEAATTRGEVFGGAVFCVWLTAGWVGGGATTSATVVGTATGGFTTRGRGFTVAGGFGAETTGACTAVLGVTMGGTVEPDPVPRDDTNQTIAGARTSAIAHNATTAMRSMRTRGGSSYASS